MLNCLTGIGLTKASALNKTHVQLFTKRPNFTVVQIENICRRQNKCSLTVYHTIPTFNDPEKEAF